MADFVESAKNFVSAAVSRTSWEASKQMRVRSKQGELDKLLEQRHKLLDEMAQVAMSQYQQGVLADPQLSRICAGIMELDHDVKSREVQLQELKKEGYSGDQSAPGPTPDYSPPPFTPPSSASSNQQAKAGPNQQTSACPTCGNPVRANSLYCRSCGTKLR
ncbi:MAG: zinc-ribbon domain-containing protein [Ktedonobacteraceae bacterium]